MSEKSYVIRGLHFGYNDECFYVNGAYSQGIYKKKQDAEAEYKKLEVKAALDFNFSQSAPLIDDEPEQLTAKLEAFFLELGEEWDGSYLSQTMSEDSILQFLDLIDWHFYRLIEFDGEPRFYGLWWNQEECYESESDEEGTFVTFEPDPNDFAELISERYGKKTFHGSLEDLSRSPLLLEKLIKSDTKLIYDADKKKLTVSKNNGSSWIALAKLLKNPPFELRPLTLEQMDEISREYSEDDY